MVKVKNKLIELNPVKKLNDYLKERVSDYLLFKQYKYIFQYERFFGSLVPEVFLNHILFLNLIGMFFCCLTIFKTFGLIFFVPFIACAIWWNSVKRDMKDNIYKKAKEEFLKQKDIWCNCGLSEALYRMTFDWEDALSNDFGLNVAKRINYHFEWETKRRAFNETKNKYENNYRQRYKTNYSNPNNVNKAMKELGIPSLSGMTQDKLKGIYRTLAKKYHPDVNPKYTKKFQNIGEAYNTLKAYV